MKFVLLSLLLAAIAASINGLTILSVLPFGSKSHFAIGHAITKSLHNAGHEVTVISPYPQKKKLPNYHDIDVSSVLEQFDKGEEFYKNWLENRFSTIFFFFSESIPNPFFLGDMNPLALLAFLYSFGDNMVSTYMQHPNVLKFMKTDKVIDVCIFENFNADAFMVPSRKTLFKVQEVNLCFFSVFAGDCWSLWLYLGYLYNIWCC